jgi:hypothetical protein
MPSVIAIMKVVHGIIHPQQEHRVSRQQGKGKERGGELIIGGDEE